MECGTEHKIDLPSHGDQDTTRHCLDQGGGFFTYSEQQMHITVVLVNRQTQRCNILELGCVGDLPIKLRLGKLPGPWVTGLDGARVPWKKAGGRNQ